MLATVALSLLSMVLAFLGTLLPSLPLLVVLVSHERVRAFFG